MLGCFFVSFLESSTVNLQKKNVFGDQRMDCLFFFWLKEKKSVMSLQVWSIIIFIFHNKTRVTLPQEYSYQLTAANTLGHTTLTQDCTSASFLDIHLNYNHRQFASPLGCKFLNSHLDLSPSYLVSSPLPRSWTVGYSDIKRKKSSSCKSKTLIGFYRRFQRVQK